MSSGFRDTLAGLLRARYPVLYVESFEEQRVLAEIRSVAGDTARLRTPRGVTTWSSSEGLVGPDDSHLPNTMDPERALRRTVASPDPGVFVFRDLHPWLGHGNRNADQFIVRLLRDAAHTFQNGPVAKAIILLSPVLVIPPELAKEVTLVDFPLPSPGELHELLGHLLTANAHLGQDRVGLDTATRERLVTASAGLTLHEAENVLARALTANGVSSTAADLVAAEKRRIVRTSGQLEFLPAQVTLDDVGGLGNLKRWLERRNGSWLSDAQAYGLPAPKGIMVTGVPGCGKTMTAKATAAAWDLPLLRLDIGRLFAGLVGSSEQNMRTAIRTAEAVAPCILWVDEIEKGFGSFGSGGGDSGTTARVFGSFLTWMQEKTHPVFVIATANGIENLPAEFLRKGRFDEIFFVDLPTHDERVQIWRLQLERRLQVPAVAGELTVDTVLLDLLSRTSEGYSGAEIEQAVVAALFEAFTERRPLRTDDLLDAVSAMVPLSLTQFEQVESLRSWAALRAVPATAENDRGDELLREAGPRLPGKQQNRSIDDRHGDGGTENR
jgi:ATP-dependent 26S proteasome regulatory subunit